MSDEPATDTLEPPADEPAHDVAPEGRDAATHPDDGYRRMVGGGPSAAFFDLDRTLISGSSAFIMGRTARAAGLVPTRQFMRDAGSAVVFKLRGGSDKKTDDVRDRMLAAVTGMRQDDLIASTPRCCRSCWRRSGPRLAAPRPPPPGRAQHLHRVGGARRDRRAARPCARHDGRDRHPGAVKDGVYNGRLAGPFCYGEGKVVAMQEIARWDGLDLEQCYGYSDSASDLPMLQAVGHPVAVNPDARLARHARAYGWPIVHFSQRTKSVIRRSVAAAAATEIAAGSFAAGTVYAKRR